MSNIEQEIYSYLQLPEFSISSETVQNSLEVYREVKNYGFTCDDVETFPSYNTIGISIQKGDEFLDIEIQDEEPLFRISIEKGIGSEYEKEYIIETNELTVSVTSLTVSHIVWCFSTSTTNYIETIKIRNDLMKKFDTM